MKKILVLIAILALVPMVSAGVIIKDGGGATVAAGSTVVAAAGETLTFTFYQDTPQPDGSAGEIYISATGDNKSMAELAPTPVFDAGTGLYGWNWALNSVSVTGAGDFLAQYNVILGTGTPGVGSVMNGIPVPTYPQDYVGTFSFSFDFTENTTVAFDGIWDGQDTAGLNFNVIPEPISIALLGLGGLFIRRRKA